MLGRASSPPPPHEEGRRLGLRYGAHHDSYPTAYITAAAAMGIRQADVDLFLKRFDKALGEWKKVEAPKKAIGATEEEARAEGAT